MKILCFEVLTSRTYRKLIDQLETIRHDHKVADNMNHILTHDNKKLARTNAQMKNELAKIRSKCSERYERIRTLKKSRDYYKWKISKK